MNVMLEHALAYARFGWRVLPVEPKGKKPLINDWPNKATVNEAQISKWWGERWPDANIGVATGKGSGFFVLDADGPEGIKSWNRLETELARVTEMPDFTLTQKTPRGMHFFFKYPKTREVRNRTGIRPGLDVRGEGGYVVVAPSIHPSGDIYRWPEGLEEPIAVAPKELLDVITRSDAEGVDVTQQQGNSPSLTATVPQQPAETSESRETAYLKAALADEVSAVARTPEGSRNSKLNEAAFKLSQLIEAGLSEDDITRELLAAAQRCGLPEREAQKTIASGIKAGRQQPRGVPEPPEAPNVDTSGLLAKIHQSSEAPVPEVVDLGWRPFPIECLPPEVVTFIKTVAIAHCVDEAFVALPVLGTASAALGAKFTLRIKDGFDLPPTLWCAIVAETGSNKSGPLRVVTNPMWNPVPQPTFGTEIATGYQHRWVVTDATTEAILALLAHCPNGLLLVADELAGWLESFDAYKKGKGGDEKTWIALWNVEPHAVDRKTDREENVLMAPAVAVVGGIQPVLLQKCTHMEKLASGFFPRTLLAMPPRRKRKWTDNGVPQETIDLWGGIVDAMRCRPFAALDSETKQFTPNIVTLSPEAKLVWEEHYEAVAIRLHETTGIELMLASKYDVHAGRLALVHHCLLCAAGETDWDAPLFVESMKAGAQMALWFLDETLRVFQSVCFQARAEQRKRLVALIKRKGGTMTVRELMRSNDRFKPADYARAALQDLAEAGFGEFVENKFTLRPNGEIELRS